LDKPDILSNKINKPFIAPPPKNAANVTLYAAQDDDDLMSQQQQSIPDLDKFMENWAQQISAARINWGKLTVNELYKTEGEIQKLIGLVQVRYVVARSEASKQVNNFLENTKY
jgi:uncharacterized protein YjbJ (UPF0337 family)